MDIQTLDIQLWFLCGLFLLGALVLLCAPSLTQRTRKDGDRCA